MQALSERAMEFVLDAAAQDTLKDNGEVVVFLLMLITNSQKDKES